MRRRGDVFDSPRRAAALPRFRLRRYTQLPACRRKRLRRRPKLLLQPQLRRLHHLHSRGTWRRGSPLRIDHRLRDRHALRPRRHQQRKGLRALLRAQHRPGMLRLRDLHPFHQRTARLRIVQVGPAFIGLLFLPCSGLLKSRCTKVSRLLVLRRLEACRHCAKTHLKS